MEFGQLKQMAVIGLDVTNASLALALRALTPPLEVILYDDERAVARRALAEDICDSVARGYEQACLTPHGNGPVDLVVIGGPQISLADRFAGIAPHLKPGVLVTDTARLKAPSMALAEAHLPADVHFVGGHVIPNPTAGVDAHVASAERLEDALYCLTTPRGTSADIIETVSALAEAVGATPLFIGVAEHDGLLAAAADLPLLLALALLRATTSGGGWHELRKLTGQRFLAATEPLALEVAEPADEAAALMANREHTIRRLNQMLTELVRLRDILEAQHPQEDEDALAESLADALTARAGWLNERQRGLWGAEGRVDQSAVPTTGQALRGLFLGERPRRRDGES
jgi:prephenate dehydrogenase